MKKLFLAMAVTAMTLFASCGNSNGAKSDSAAGEQQEASAENVDVNAILDKVASTKDLSNDFVKNLKPAEVMALAQAVTDWSNEGMKALKDANGEEAKLASVKAFVAAHPKVEIAREIITRAKSDKFKDVIGLTPEQVDKVQAAREAYQAYYDQANLDNVSKPLFDL